LKKLILHGFKSFADRTEFTFDQPITGIVGPNGCGKSNVVDGFKWVLGEQSAKSLRGEAMMDVIFNGSSARKASGMSEVVLVFDNPKRTDGTRLLNVDTDEVSVGRRLFRDGTSEYQVNTQSARLKDIRELFFDTGIGVDAYSVIEQGRVAMLLESNPQERRLIFEEAAGISKFKAKKKETQRKLERVDQNLLRVTDIVEEVDKRLRSVRIQAGRARTYKEHSERLKELRLTYALQEYYTLQSQLDEHVSAEGKCQAELENIQTELSEKQLALGQNRHQYDSLCQRKQKAEYELVQSRAALQSCQQRQHYAQQQLQQIAEQLRQFAQDREGLSAKAGEVSNSLTAEQQNLAKLTAEVAEHRGQIEQKQQAFRDTQLQLNQINNEVEQHKTAILDLMRRSAAVNNRLGAIEIERKNINAQQQRLGQRRQVVMSEIQTLDAARTELDAALAKVSAEIGSLQGHIEESGRQATALGRQIATISEQHGAAREHRSGLISRQKLLEDLEANREGISEGVNSVLRQRAEKFPFIRGLVADVLRVDVEHALVIEAALDGRDQLLIADDSAAVAAAAEDLQELEGRVNILCSDSSLITHHSSLSSDSSLPSDSPLDYYDWNQHPQRIRLAIDLVRVQPADAAIAQHLLGRTIVVDSLADARALHAAAPAGFRFVTKEGQLLDADGTLRIGPIADSMSLISRRSELDALKSQVAEVDRRIEQLTAQLSTGNAQAKALQVRQNELRNALYQANTRKVETTSRIAQNTDKQSSFRREMPLLERELQNFLDQFGRLKIEETGLQEKRQSIETEQAQRQKQVEDLTKKQADDAELLKQSGEALTSLRVELGQVQEKQIASQQTVGRLTSAQAELAEQIERIDASAKQTAARRAAIEAELQQALAAEKELDNRQNKLARHIEIINADIAKFQAAVAELSAAVEQVNARHAESSQALHQLQIKIGEVRVRLEGLVQRTMDEIQLDLPARWTELQQQGGYQPSETNWDAVADEIKLLKDKIQRLGNVNLDAIGEMDELEKRQQFLSTQVTDLTESKRQLEELIETINNESADRFQKTFAAVREHFQGMFRKLFGGGKADILLETELEPAVGSAGPLPSGSEAADATPGGPADLPAPRKIDILDAGIEIIAKPPGKQPVNISQLSGGEKTMTCIALLMSIFKSKPSPFCLLDEVDAALDEANNQRFNLIVQEFLEQSQFIIITHSKRTMQIADVLYGVTMQEQGVSKRVAVKFDQVDSQGRIKEHAAA
jgi:chromosome segregation protein